MAMVDKTEELAKSSRELTETVRQLAGSVHEMAQELSATQEAAAEATRTAQATKEDVAENTIPKQTIQLRWAEEEKRLKKIRRRGRIWVIAAVVIGVASAVAVLLISDAKLSSYKNQRFQACQDHNAEVTKEQQQSKTFFEPLLAKEKAEAHPDPVLIITLTAIENTPPQLAVCKT